MKEKLLLKYFLQKVVKSVAREGSLTARILHVSALVAALFLLSCSGGKTSTADEAGDTITLRHARNIIMVQYADRIGVTILDPWHEGVALQHIDIRQPLKKAAVFTAVHCGLLGELGVKDAVAGVCELDYVNLPWVHEGVRDGRIADLGSGLSPNLERIMELEPDALMPTPFEDNGGYGKMERMGIPIIQCADYMERSPLARAEWMRFYGRLFGVGERADSIFDAVERDYTALCDTVRRLPAVRKPKLLVEMPVSGHWYVAGGESTMGLLYRDAGFDYLFSDVPGAGSTALGIERVAEKALTTTDDDLWLVKRGDMISKEDIFQDVPLLRGTRARLYICNTLTSGFFEEVPFHPERLLRCLISLAHPELGLGGKAYFVAP